MTRKTHEIIQKDPPPRVFPTRPASVLVDNAKEIFQASQGPNPEKIEGVWFSIAYYDSAEISRDAKFYASGNASRLRKNPPISWPPGHWELDAVVVYDDALSELTGKKVAKGSELFLRLIHHADETTFAPGPGRLFKKKTPPESPGTPA